MDEKNVQSKKRKKVDEVSQFIKILRTIFGNFYLISTEYNDVAVWYLN